MLANSSESRYGARRISLTDEILMITCQHSQRAPWKFSAFSHVRIPST